MKNNVFFENRLRKWFAIGLLVIILVYWTSYVLWAKGIVDSIVLKESVPESDWVLFISFSLLTGLVLMGIFYLCFNLELEFYVKIFAIGAGLGFASIETSSECYVYFFPDRVIGYESEYRVTFPGPIKKKLRGSCEAGLWIKDQNTNRWFHLCTTEAYLRDHHQRGTTKVWVTARINNIGSYIMSYEFIHNGNCEPDGTNPKQQDYFRECWY